MIAATGLLGVLILSAGSAPTPSADRLFFLDTAQGGRCRWMVRELPAGKPRQLFETKECPTDIVWDPASAELVFVTSSKLVRWPWRQAGAKASMVELPVTPVLGLWLDAKSGNPTIATIVTPEREVSTGDKPKFVYQGKPYDASDLPPFGNAGLALQYELHEKKWQRVAVVATRFEAGDAPGIGVLERRAKSGTVTLSQLLEQGLAAKHEFPFAALGAKPDLAKQLRSELGAADEGSNDPGYLALDGGSGLLFQQQFGDSLHATPPVFLCRDRCARREQLRQLEPFARTGVAITRHGRYALLADEYSGGNGRIYTADDAKPMLVLPPSQGATWLSDGIF